MAEPLIAPDAAAIEQVRLRYQHFADYEAFGVSPRYVELALAVVASPPLLRFIAALPVVKQQPNLVFAAVRHLYGTPSDGPHLAELVERNQAAIRALILARRTQTNEPARCATLLPVLCQLPQPLALLEVGASAGLCLLPDLWGYDYGRIQIAPPSAHAPVFACHANAATPLPDRLPTVVWRAGLDLNPIDLADADSVGWLETLVWPGQEDRLKRLHAAIHVARANPPRVLLGDLLTDLTALAATAPRDATLVIFHSAVLTYVDQAHRARFVETVQQLDAVWVSNEGPYVFPEVDAKLNRDLPENQMLLALNGEPVALTAGHGQSITWLA